MSHKTETSAAGGGEVHETASFFYLDERIDGAAQRMTGAQIKRAILGKVASFDFSHSLVLEGEGSKADRLIGDDEEVLLRHGHDEHRCHFYSKPPTNFGA